MNYQAWNWYTQRLANGLQFLTLSDINYSEYWIFLNIEYEMFPKDAND